LDGEEILALSDPTDASSTPLDTDGDGVLNSDDLCEGYDDAIDTDTDGTPYGCDDSGELYCEETDSGVDYTTRGQVSINGVLIGTDQCDGSSVIVEYYCDSTSSSGYNYNFIPCTDAMGVSSSCDTTQGVCIV
jgi:hypothetical protein